MNYTTRTMGFGPKSLLIDDILLDLVSALGNGSAALIHNSQTEIGLLAVKSADISLDFELSSLETERGTELAARLPLFFPVASLTEKNQSLEARNINKGTIRLQIVSVAEKVSTDRQTPARDVTAEVPVEQDSADVAIGRAWTTKDQFMADLLVQTVREIKNVIRDVEVMPDLTKPPIRVPPREELDQVEKLVRGKYIGEAQDKLTDLINAHPDLIRVVQRKRTEEATRLTLTSRTAKALSGVLQTNIDSLRYSVRLIDPGKDSEKALQKSAMLAKLGSIQTLLAEQKLGEASELLDRFAQDHPEQISLTFKRKG